jgi:hypothetical protein
MADEEYVADLRAMLTSLNPIGSGSGARVTSMRVVQDVAYDELEIEFDAVVDGEDLGSGSVRVDIDRDWRELSGYAEPGSYIQVVVRELERAVRRVVRPQPSTPSIDPDRAWADLLRNLGYHGTVREVGDGRLEVTEHDGEVFTLQVTRKQWAQVWAHVSDDYFHDLLGPRSEDETFVVFHRDDLARSVREALPPVRSTAFERLIEERRAANPDATFGWFAARRPEPD